MDNFFRKALPLFLLFLTISWKVPHGMGICGIITVGFITLRLTITTVHWIERTINKIVNYVKRR
jgi:hypothetical protein